MLAPSGGGLILYQAYGNLYAMTDRKAHLLEDKQIPNVRVFDEVQGKLPLVKTTDVASRMLDGAVKLPKQLFGESVVSAAVDPSEVVQPAKGRRGYVKQEYDTDTALDIRSRILVNKAREVMSSASSAVTYTSVYTDSEPSRVFWGADDEEIIDGGIPRVITPPVPQDEDEREPMFIQPHDPDYVPEPIYPEYIPLEDEHEFPIKEQPLPPVDSPTVELPGQRMVRLTIPWMGGDDGDDDDGDSSGDDADDEDEDEEDEEEHLALANSVIVVPNVELVSLPEGTKPVIPPPSTNITTTGARITVWLQASISLPPEAEIERLLAMPTPPPSPLTSLSPPSARERLARCTSLSAHSSPLPMPSPLLPSSGYPIQI
ncbi:putative reverse transcriptase domain-containing protein [Tanacetum coccineum]